MTPHELTIAYLIDWLFGDPKGYPHPVRMIGRAIFFLEGKLLCENDPPLKKRVKGGMLVVLIVGGTALSTWAIFRMAGWVHPILSFGFAVFFAYTTLAIRSLRDEVKGVIETLEKGDLIQARKEVGFLVGRDTDQLDEKEVCRALIETTAENTSDGIIAPLFYLAIGGPILAMAYKALNTLDSMVGYKNERYQYFGWASARLDDLANFIPSRLTALFFILAAFFLKKDWRSAWRVMCRDAKKNVSPNSGYPEAAVAGALNIQLGGENLYFGKYVRKPFIGNLEKSINPNAVRESLHLMIAVSMIAVMTTILMVNFK
ncbi:MAG: cobalamin biosynthesis protein CobD [Deltaproteobacteria bacterium]|nr:cobalamin biosynthesis protein CobD [Deltaproteobacteria bacterium]MBM4322387.1 cobalamin biosynthesis protein CobD [Deltaproteobacteria bacterium]